MITFIQFVETELEIIIECLEVPIDDGVGFLHKHREVVYRGSTDDCEAWKHDLNVECLKGVDLITILHITECLH